MSRVARRFTKDDTEALRIALSDYPVKDPDDARLIWALHELGVTITVYVDGDPQ